MVLLQAALFMLAVIFSIINIVKMIYRNRIPSLNMILWGLSVGGYLLMQFHHVLIGV